MALDTIISRPVEGGTDERLDDHLEAVGTRMHALGSFDESGTPSAADIAYCIGRLHDFGKVTPGFQAHVRGKRYKRKQNTYHARISGLAAFWAVRELGGADREALAAFAAIARHHGQLPNFTSYTLHTVVTPERNEEEVPGKWATIQVAEIDEQYAEEADSLLRAATRDVCSWDTFRTAIESGVILDGLADAVSETVGFNQYDLIPEQLPSRLYDRTLRYWSSLTLADKSCAGGVSTRDLRKDTLALDPLEDYITTLETDDELQQELNHHRERARTSVRDRAVSELVYGDADVGTLTLPTGLGKTFTGISAAFAVRDARVEHEALDEEPTVVYALPFTSIIEQTRELFEHSQIWNADPTSNAFTVHHYLTETINRLDSEDQAENGAPEQDSSHHAEAMLGESWRAGTILTTFVQLFESLAGPSNSEGLKLPSLQNAVVILDEPQTLPKRWWPVIPRLVSLLTEEFTASVIAMTATQPRLFTDTADVSTTELVDNVNAYYEQARRVRYTVDESVWEFPDEDTAISLVSHENAGQRIVRSITADSPSDSLPGAHSAMAVCNTIASSRRLTETVRDTARKMGFHVQHLGEIYEDVIRKIEQTERLDTKCAISLVLTRLGFDIDMGTSAWYWDGEDSPPFLLATFNSRYRPRDRRVLVGLAEQLTDSNCPFVFVTTQAVEAGVDLSFAQVFRDLAPLDSIVQAAGRCNRSFEWGREGGDVTVWFLADPDDPDAGHTQAPVTYVYDDVAGHIDLLCRTLREELPKRTNVDEMVLTRRAVPTYFDALADRTIGNQALPTAVDHFDAEFLGQHSLIHEEYQTVDLLIAVSDRDEQLVEAIRDAFNSENASKAFELLSDVSDLRVSIPTEDADEHLQMLTRIDGQPRGTAEGVNILVHRPSSGQGSYDLDKGGFVAEGDDPLAGRFTI